MFDNYGGNYMSGRVIHKMARRLYLIFSTERDFLNCMPIFYQLLIINSGTRSNKSKLSLQIINPLLHGLTILAGLIMPTILCIWLR